MEINVDLHLHGLYSGAVSDRMIPSVIAENAPLKGIDVVGSADILNDRWIKLIKEQLKTENDEIYEHENGTKFVLQTEVEDNQRIHHIILFPSMSKVEEVREEFKKKCKNLDVEGRPKIWMNGEEILDTCSRAGALVGFSHAFTPYFGLYSKYHSYKDCYGNNWKKICFMELGLSADTNMADRIKELHELTFTSNSDAHSPWPNKLGREFNRLKVNDINFKEIEMALKRMNGRKCILNIKFDPREGKYHKTRCTGCLKFHDPVEAMKLKWRCNECGKPIKKGVDYRIFELTNAKENEHPDFRAECRHIIPLSEIIALAYGIKDSWSIKVQEMWKKYADKFGTEINALLNAEINELEKIDKNIAKYIQLFRESKIEFIPGGAGVYGKLLKPGEKYTIEKKQKSLSEF